MLSKNQTIHTHLTRCHRDRRGSRPTLQILCAQETSTKRSRKSNNKEEGTDTTANSCFDTMDACANYYFGSMSKLRTRGLSLSMSKLLFVQYRRLGKLLFLPHEQRTTAGQLTWPIPGLDGTNRHGQMCVFAPRTSDKLPRLYI